MSGSVPACAAELGQYVNGLTKQERMQRETEAILAAKAENPEASLREIEKITGIDKDTVRNRLSKKSSIDEKLDMPSRSQRTAARQVYLPQDPAAAADKVKRTDQVAGRYSFDTFEEYVGARWDLEYRRAVQLIDAAAVAKNLNESSDFVPARETHVRPLLRLDSDAERASAWQAVVAKHGH